MKGGGRKSIKCGDNRREWSIEYIYVGYEVHSRFVCGVLEVHSGAFEMHLTCICVHCFVSCA